MAHVCCSPAATIAESLVSVTNSSVLETSQVEGTFSLSGLRVVGQVRPLVVAVSLERLGGSEGLLVSLKLGDISQVCFLVAIASEVLVAIAVGLLSVTTVRRLGDVAISGLAVSSLAVASIAISGATVSGAAISSVAVSRVSGLVTKA